MPRSGKPADDPDRKSHKCFVTNNRSESVEIEVLDGRILSPIWRLPAMHNALRFIGGGSLGSHLNIQHTRVDGSVFCWLDPVYGEAITHRAPGGRYHVTARGNERKPIYRTDGDRVRTGGTRPFALASHFAAKLPCSGRSPTTRLAGREFWMVEEESFSNWPKTRNSDFPVGLVCELLPPSSPTTQPDGSLPRHYGLPYGLPYGLKVSSQPMFAAFLTV